MSTPLHTSKSLTPADLRRQAEALVVKMALEKTVGTPKEDAGPPQDGPSRILHELAVHQVELEMQNGELRRAYASLEASRARYFDLYDLAPVGYVTVSDSGLILETNLTAAALLGLPRGELVNEPISRAIGKEDQDIFYLMRKKLIETGEPQACELRMVKSDGLAFWARMEASVALADGFAPVCRISISNISDRKQAEALLQESGRMLRESQIVAGLGTYVLDIPAGTWTSSEVMDHIFGIDASYEHSVEGWAALIHPNDRTMMEEYFKNEVLGRRRTFDREYRILRHNDQVECWVHGQGKLEGDAEGTLLKMIGTIQDISWRKLAEEELQKKN